MNINVVIKDIETQIKVQTNNEYKNNLLKEYQEFKFSNISTKDEFEDSNKYKYTYEEITFFDRMNYSKYAQFITSSAIDMIYAYTSSIDKKDSFKL